MRYRLAKPGDVVAILSIMEEIAIEIPLAIRDEVHKRQLAQKVREWFALNTSIVALGKDEGVLGFQLASPTNGGEKLGNLWAPASDGIMLQYAGVTKVARKQGIFSALIERMKRHGLPLYATVKHSNRSAMANRLVRMGFEKFATNGHFDQDHFRWTPRD
jgi:GNAT superfamily N-acetyltransferase